MLYETLLLLGVLSVTFIVPHLILGLAWGISLPGVLLWLHLFLVIGVYFIWLWCRDGQTLAMQTWRVRLIDANSGNPVSRTKALLRYTLAWPAVLALGAGLVWALFDRDRQFLHDRLAGSRLVLLPPGNREPI